jgi:hypothetical protein
VKRALPQAGPSVKLALPTIMDRALAIKHGAPYVHLSAFAIDVDRVYAETSPLEEDELPEAAATKHAQHDALPFGWEVFLTGARLHALDTTDIAVLAMLEDTCNHVLGQSPDEQGYGSQLVFAVYDCVQRGTLPLALGDLFRSWRSRPKQLIRSLNAMWKNTELMLPMVAAHCTATTLDPPLAPPTLATLEAMTRGEWALRSDAAPPRTSD